MYLQAQFDIIVVGNELPIIANTYKHYSGQGVVQ
jgi:hypothetical protein